MTTQKQYFNLSPRGSELVLQLYHMHGERRCCPLICCAVRATCESQAPYCMYTWLAWSGLLTRAAGSSGRLAYACRCANGGQGGAEIRAQSTRRSAAVLFKRADSVPRAPDLVAVEIADPRGRAYLVCTGARENIKLEEGRGAVARASELKTASRPRSDPCWTAKVADASRVKAATPPSGKVDSDPSMHCECEKTMRASGEGREKSTMMIQVDAGSDSIRAHATRG